ncbi:NlpC/P60 family protein [Melghirimyces profundicolus]|uniref:NlpC/P60 family protein n=1 Tax=Melghirimyces profundicolus TaxID=1242148 RepID=A0A2T6BG69_9BACL|nr:C40 family peptidase [Melghirimyces profundicolus]PTX55050.1 NlpC/P60 family protein [Melghirimyces profundicolus]
MRTIWKGLALMAAGGLVWGLVGCMRPGSQQGQENRQPRQMVNQPDQADDRTGVPAPQQNAFGERIVETGRRYLGTPYQFGAEYEESGKFDCSSFTQYVFAKNGVDLPRRAEPQAQIGVEVPKNELKKGDLLFFKLRSKPNRGIEHVGIYAGDGKILHTYGPGGVRFDDLSERWLEWGYVKATRVRP